uniref:G-protein coupled receptors family 2 profile 2 domain-containing protein n=1 Tax=Amphimedon queenslandica TaxID=400682 RepID=A0A1X7V5J6_AMPQE
MEVEEGNGTRDAIYCGQSIKDILRPLLVVYSTSGSVCFIFCLVAIAAMVIFRLFKLLTHRLILYTLVSILSYSLTSIFQFSGLWWDFWEDDEYTDVCIFIGFAQEYADWVMLLSTLMMTLHLTVMVMLPSYYEKVAKLEPFYLIFPWIFPIFVAWVPFFHNNYGIGGSWCWIKLHRNCSFNEEGVIMMYAVWYGELIVGLILNNIALIIIGLTLCKRAYKNTTSLDYRKALKQTLPLLAYPITYQFLSSFAIANRIYIAFTGGKYNKWLFYAHAATAPCWGIFAPIFTFIYLLFLLKVIKENIKQWCCCFKTKKKQRQLIINKRNYNEDESARERLIDPHDHLTQYGVTVVTCPTTTAEFKRESEIDEEYEIID